MLHIDPELPTKYSENWLDGSHLGKSTLLGSRMNLGFNLVVPLWQTTPQTHNGGSSYIMLELGTKMLLLEPGIWPLMVATKAELPYFNNSAGPHTYTKLLCKNMLPLALFVQEK